MNKPSAVIFDMIGSSRRSDVQSLVAIWPEQAGEVTDRALAVQAIPAPTFHEHQRSEYVRLAFEQTGLSDVTIDETGNVYGRIPGELHTRPALLISAHLDTVFPAETDLGVRRDHETNRIYGAGLGDNSLGVAGMLELTRQLKNRAIRFPADIWCVATVGEEGLGNLRGIRAACQVLAGKLGLAIILEGMGFGRVCHAGLGVRRLRIEVTGPGGHSWIDSERPSAIHSLVQIGAALVDAIKPQKDPKSTFNIGLIEGGTSINSRAPSASLSIDLRCADQKTLANLEQAVRRIVQAIKQPPDMQCAITTIGERPASALSVDHPLAHAAAAALAYLGTAPIFEVGSTDANIPLSLGLPSVCIGLTTGGNAHSRDEYIDTQPVATGMQQLALLVCLAAEHTEDWKAWN